LRFVWKGFEYGVMGRRVAARRVLNGYSASCMMGGSLCALFIVWRIALLGFRIGTLYI